MGTKKEAILTYYTNTAQDVYDRWQAGEGGYHLTFYENPPDFRNTQPEQVIQQHQESHRKILEKVAGFLDIEKGDLVLDAGCGNGSIFAPLEKKGASVIGINIVGNHLLKSSRKVEKLGLEKTTLLEADYSELPLKNGLVDNIVFFESLAHSPDKKTTIKESLRVLKENGEINIIEPMLTRSRSLLPNEALVLTEQIDDGMALHFTSFPDLVETITDLGLAVTSKRDFTINVLPSIQLAASSAEEHLFEESSDDIRRHRIATINCRDLIEKGIIKYLFIKVKRVIG
jgi:ubiquinone/menaquinone biosynthesis C-methylase UbiE